MLRLEVVIEGCWGGRSDRCAGGGFDERAEMLLLDQLPQPVVLLLTRKAEVYSVHVHHRFTPGREVGRDARALAARDHRSVLACEHPVVFLASTHHAGQLHPTPFQKPDKYPAGQCWVCWAGRLLCMTGG